MNYNVEVYRTTKRGHMETLLQFVVNSQNSMYEIQNHLARQYKGFNISIKEVETVNIDIKSEENQTILNPVKAAYASYDGYYVDKAISKEDLSLEDKAEWDSLSSRYLSLCRSIQKKYIDENEKSIYTTKIKPFSLYPLGLPKVQIYLTSDLMREF